MIVYKVTTTGDNYRALYFLVLDNIVIATTAGSNFVGRAWEGDASLTCYSIFKTWSDYLQDNTYPIIERSETLSFTTI